MFLIRLGLLERDTVKIRLYFNMDKIINVLMVILICSFTILTSYSWGRYVMLGCTGLILCVQVFRNNGKYKLFSGVFPFVLALFTFYSLISSLWAERSTDSITVGKTLFEITVMVYILYTCYFENPKNTNDLLRCIKWSGYIISLYSIFFYGLDFLIIAAANETRLENTYANVNTIGMLSSICIVIQVDEFICEKRWKWEALLCLPSIFIVALTHSRKALLLLILGTFLCFLLHNLDSKNILKTIGKISAIVLVALVLLNVVALMPIFAGTFDRMNALFGSIFGDGGGADSSVLIRDRMIEVGWEQFLKTPLLGMGMANPHILSNMYLGKDAYLHNNFIELLAGGGIVGLSIYYSMYAYLLTMFWKLRRYKNEEYVICLVMTVVLLILDYGMVSYYQKIRYVYLLVMFLEIEALKKKAEQG